MRQNVDGHYNGQECDVCGKIDKPGDGFKLKVFQKVSEDSTGKYQVKYHCDMCEKCFEDLKNRIANQDIEYVVEDRITRFFDVPLGSIFKCGHVIYKKVRQPYVDEYGKDPRTLEHNAIDTGNGHKMYVPIWSPCHVAE